MERTGSRALSVFARVLNARILRAHDKGSLSTGDLDEKLGWAAKTSLRAATARLCELGTLERGGTQTTSMRLTAAGQDLLVVADAVEGWLSNSAFGALELSDPAARGTVRTLVAGWDFTLVQALAGRPRSLADLRAEIAEHSYPTLKRRFAKLRGAALVASTDDGLRSPEYEATPFLRRAVAPLILAARWERRHAPDVQSPTARDLGALLLLALPLVELSPSVSGSCALAVPPARESADDVKPSPAVVGLAIKEGRIASLHPAPDPTPKTWVAGSADAWLDALTEGRLGSLRLRGPDTDLAVAVVDGLQHTLFKGIG